MSHADITWAHNIPVFILSSEDIFWRIWRRKIVLCFIKLLCSSGFDLNILENVDKVCLFKAKVSPIE